MHVTRALKFMSLPAALGLGTALILACADAGPTAPGDTVSPAEVAKPFAAPKKGHTGGGSIDNLSVGGGCQAEYFVATINNPGSGADANEDGIICTKRATKK